MSELLAWHFTNGPTLRDGTPLEVGRTYTVMPPLRLCERGLHASVRAIDALKYAPGATISRVVLSGDIIADTDKHVASQRRVLWYADATRMLHEFALVCAEDALGLIEEPDPRSRRALAVKRRWLDGRATDQELAAARAAARDAAWDAARDAAWAAARDAAWDAVRAAAWAAARDAVRDAAWAAARDAVRAAGWAAARDAAWAAAWDAQNAVLETMLAALGPRRDAA